MCVVKKSKMEISEFTVAALREMCKRGNLALGGKKTDLIKRLDKSDPSGKWREDMKYVQVSDEKVVEGPDEHGKQRGKEQESDQEDEREDA